MCPCDGPDLSGPPSVVAPLSVVTADVLLLVLLVVLLMVLLLVLMHTYIHVWLFYIPGFSTACRLWIPSPIHPNS